MDRDIKRYAIISMSSNRNIITESFKASRHLKKIMIKYLKKASSAEDKDRRNRKETQDCFKKRLNHRIEKICLCPTGMNTTTTRRKIKNQVKC
jgi:hypothetical protein